MSTPDELDPDDIDARWRDLTAELGDVAGHREVPRPPASGPRDYIAEDDDGAFEPPEPETEPFQLRAMFGWILLIGGIIGILVSAIGHGSTALGVVSAVSAVSGLVVLATGLPTHHDPDDDGARV